MKYVNARTQFVVTEGHMEHLEAKVRDGGTFEERERFRNAKIQFLDTLADLLNSSEIAKQWEDTPLMKENSVTANKMTPEMDKQNNFKMTLIVGIAIFTYMIAGVVYIFANFHK